jgi:hypothetical protein
MTKSDGYLTSHDGVLVRRRSARLLPGRHAVDGCGRLRALQ